MTDRKPKSPLHKISSGWASRGLSLTKLGLKTGAQWAARGVSRLVESEEIQERRWKDFLISQARSFSQEIGQLKGSLMKAGQMLSMYGEHFFPPEVNQFLKTLQQDSPPLSWEAIEPVLARELGPERMARLTIDPEPVAAASLGQVHRAVVKGSGDVLALKIQYPGVDQAIESDLKALRMLLTMIQAVPKDLDLSPLFAETKSMLQQEVDYELEAHWTHRQAEMLADDPRFAVPGVRAEFCTRRVLATEFQEGVRIDSPEVASLPLERRNRLAASLLDLYFRELFQWRFVQTDPHPGNYRLRLSDDGNDQWVLLDFGATRGFPEEFVNSYRNLIRAALFKDRPAFMAAALELRFVEADDDPELLRLFETFCFALVEPFRADTYDWKNTDLPQRTSQAALEILRNFKWRTPPREILFLDRKTGGIFVMMGILGANFSAREILLKYLD